MKYKNYRRSALMIKKRMPVSHLIIQARPCSIFEMLKVRKGEVTDDFSEEI